MNSSGVLPPALLSDQFDESAAANIVGEQFIAPASRQNENLLIARTDGHDGHAAVLQLSKQQIARQIRRAGGNNNSVKRPLFRPTQRAIPKFEMDISDAQRHEPFKGPIEQRLKPFDRPDFRRQFGKHGGLIAAASPDFQHMMSRLHIQPVRHQRDNIGLTNRLAMADGCGAVGKRISRLAGKNFSRGVERNAASTRSSRMPRPMTCCWSMRSSWEISVRSVLCISIQSRLMAVGPTDHWQSAWVQLTLIFMPRHPARPELRRPIVTLTTDFGTRDFYVSAMKAALVRLCPDVRLIDVTHEVPRQDILCGSITLERAIDGFPPGTVHLAVVDPGVGTDRRILIVELNGQKIIAPDNGLITWPWRRLGPGKIWELIWRPTSAISNTFHGRDIMAPAVAMLACGTPPAELGKPIDDPILLGVAPAATRATTGRIIHIDQFGNATTNIGHEALAAFASKVIRVRNKTVGKIRRTYWDVAPGKPLALVGSSGLLEIAVRDGSAKDDLKLKVGDEVKVD